MKKVFLLLLTFISLHSFAQDQCVVVRPSGSESTQRDPQACDYNAANTSKYCLNVFFHIVRDDNGANGFDPLLLPGIETNLNTYFNMHGIKFTSIGHDFIYNTGYNNIANQAQFNALTLVNIVPNAINIYLVNGCFAKGIAHINDYRCAVKNSWALSMTSPHEVAHTLALEHIFNNIPCSETPSTCLVCGDFVCDTGVSTPANNIMSYDTDRYLFTAGQGIRMRNAIKCHRLAQRTNRCASVTGANRMCGTATSVTYTLTDQLPGATATWSVTSNLQVLSSTGTTITVKPINTSVNGMATITANVGGILTTKDIFIGKPIFNVIRSNIEYCEGSFHYVFVEIVNLDTTIPSTGYTYSWNIPSYPGMIFTSMGNNLYRFRFPAGFSGWLDFMVTGTNSCGSQQFYFEDEVKLCGTFTNQYPRGMAEESGPTASSKRYTIYPNPTDDAINIALVDTELHDDTRISAELVDMLGQSKGHIDIVDGQAVMNVAALRQGIYILKINVDGNVETHQIIIK